MDCRDNDACFYGLGFGGGFMAGFLIATMLYEWIKLFSLPDDWYTVLINHPAHIFATAVPILFPMIIGIIFKVWLLPVFAYSSSALILGNALRIHKKNGTGIYHQDSHVQQPTVVQIQQK